MTGQMNKIARMSDLQRALDYPYDAPADAYLIQNGHCLALPQTYDFTGRTPVLSVGSNRAPVQLNRKFGDRAELAVTPVTVHDCDVVHVANLAPYGAVPCSAFPCPGTSVDLNIAWLTPAQLKIMHQTESLGVAYDWVEWDLSVIEHRFPAPLDRLFGYAALTGAMSVAGKGPFGLARIPAKNRQFALKSQHQMQEMIYHRFCDDGDCLEDWIRKLQTDEMLRADVSAAIQQDGLDPDDPPWQTAIV